MPDTTLEDIVQPGDSTNQLDGSSLSDASQHMDLMYIGAEGLECENFLPEELGLSQDIADQVAYVLKGPDCKPIYVHPSLKEEGCDLPSVVPVESNIKFDGTMYVLAKDKGFQLEDGKMLFKAFRDACDKYPEVAVKAIGIELKPEAKDATVMQARIEQNDLGELLLRVHIWQGNGRLVSYDGQSFLDLVAGEQALVDTHLNVIEAFSIEPPNQSTETDQKEGTADSYMSPLDPETAHTASTYKENPGCNLPGGRPHAPDTMAPIFALIAALWIGRSLRQLKINPGNRGLFQAISKYLASGDNKEKKE
ncbi:MAG: hypothetical protein NTZ25_00905 [Candidatus Peregrinibacteria bacterium]|nr:hypothetical protein [Candidatus Peregrinibacteria bacterium]